MPVATNPEQNVLSSLEFHITIHNAKTAKKRKRYSLFKMKQDPSLYYGNHNSNEELLTTTSRFEQVGKHVRFSLRDDNSSSTAPSESTTKEEWVLKVIEDMASFDSFLGFSCGSRELSKSSQVGLEHEEHVTVVPPAIQQNDALPIPENLMARGKAWTDQWKMSCAPLESTKDVTRLEIYPEETVATEPQAMLKDHDVQILDAVSGRSESWTDEEDMSIYTLKTDDEIRDAVDVVANFFGLSESAAHCATEQTSPFDRFLRSKVAPTESHQMSDPTKNDTSQTCLEANDVSVTQQAKQDVPSAEPSSQPRSLDESPQYVCIAEGSDMPVTETPLQFAQQDLGVTNVSKTQNTFEAFMDWVAFPEKYLLPLQDKQQEKTPVNPSMKEERSVVDAAIPEPSAKKQADRENLNNVIQTLIDSSEEQISFKEVSVDTDIERVLSEVDKEAQEKPYSHTKSKTPSVASKGEDNGATDTSITPEVAHVDGSKGASHLIADDDLCKLRRERSLISESSSVLSKSSSSTAASRKSVWSFSRMTTNHALAEQKKPRKKKNAVHRFLSMTRT